MKKLNNIIFLLAIFLVTFTSSIQAKMFFKNDELRNIIVFENFKYEDLKDEFLKQLGIDVNYVNIFNDKKEKITETNYRELLKNFENTVTYEFKDIFGKKITKSRIVYIFSENEFRKSVVIDKKYKIKNVSVDALHSDTSINKIFVGKIFTEPKLHETKDCYILKVDRNNNIIWGKMFEGSKINKFNKIISVLDEEYYLIASAYRDSEWTDGFIVKFDEDGNFLWNDFYGSSHIDDFKDVISLENGDILVLAEVSNNDGDVKTSVTINNPLNKDLVLLRYDNKGKILWQNSVSNEKDIMALKILNDDKDVLVFGEIFDNERNENAKNIIVSGFDLNGKVKFSTIIKEFDEEMLYKILYKK